MKKKLIAVAVAGALAAPALAIAQTSTVQIYGRFTYEWGHADQGRGQRDVDYADSPGGSAIGFRGEEKLGGGLSAWFQCESSADVRALDATGLCTRNSAVGFKGGWGNLFFGRWDTPLKRALNMGTVGAEETGILGMSFLPFGGSGGADASLTGNNSGFGIESAQRQRWKRRETGLGYYETPRWNGFQGLFAISHGNAAADNNPSEVPPTAVTNAVPRVLSAAGTWQSGPIALGLGFERHLAMGAPAGAGVDQDDRGWGLSGAYTFGNNVKLGATYLDVRFETPTGEVKKKTYTIGVDWAISGPHSVQAQWAYADDCKGMSTTGIGGNGGCAAPATLVAGVVTPRSDTGGNAWSIAYSYAFSKRTRVKLGYVRVDNDTNSASYRIGNTAALVAGGPAPATAGGQNVDGYAFHIQHNF